MIQLFCQRKFNCKHLWKITHAVTVSTCKYPVRRYCSEKVITSSVRVGRVTRGHIIGICFGLAFGSVTFLWYQVWLLQERLRVTDNAYETEKGDEYIYPNEPVSLEYGHTEVGQWGRFTHRVERAAHIVLPWLQSKSSDDPRLLLALAESADPLVRHLGLKALTTDHRWKDHQYRSISQACSDTTLVSLARMLHSDPRFFRPMPYLLTTQERVGDQLISLLRSLPRDGIEDCVKHSTSKALQKGRPTNIIETEEHWCVDGASPQYLMSLRKRSEALLETFCLEALVAHTMVADQSIKLVELGGLRLLHRVYLQHQESIPICRLVAWILANLSMCIGLHQEIIQGGWVSVLHRWLNASDTALHFHATRALANLDRDWESGIHVPATYNDGVYLAHPVYRSSEKMHKTYADVVFIHGIHGGPFKTWRQADRDHADPNIAVNEGNHTQQTFFWPKDWLARDIPNIRILNVGFETELSMWNAKCHKEREKGQEFAKCPVDNTWFRSKDELFADNAMRREILSLPVACTNTTDDCPWTGELRDHENHVSTCEFAWVACDYGCLESIQRCNLTEHLMSCEARPVQCQHCSQSVINAALTKHQVLDCAKLPVQCTLCGMGDILREDIPRHLDVKTGNCSHVIISCPYRKHGCPVQDQRQNIAIHEKEAMGEHLKLLQTKLNKVDDMLNNVEQRTRRIYERTLSGRGATLIDKLHRADVGRRPVIWVAHSMGGLLIKEILHLAETDPRYSAMLDHTVGVVFFSTPHHGSPLARASNRAKYIMYPSVEVQELDTDNPRLKFLHENFHRIMSERDIPCLSYGERKKTALGLKLQLHIVPPESADPCIGDFHEMDLNHVTICKPRDEEAELYQRTLAFIRKCLFRSHVRDLFTISKTDSEKH